MAQKFVRLFGMHQIQLTACAVSRKLPKFTNTANYNTKPNREWLKNPQSENAWVKIYYNSPWLYSNDYKTQISTFPMPFLGTDHNDYWGELQVRLKQSLYQVRLGRNQSFDTQVKAWIKETSLIQPKRDLISHTYTALRVYHQDHLPMVPKDWHFESLYIAVAGKDSYRVDVKWEKEEITITSTLLDTTSFEIPEFLKG